MSSDEHGVSLRFGGDGRVAEVALFGAGERRSAYRGALPDGLRLGMSAYLVVPLREVGRLFVPFGDLDLPVGRHEVRVHLAARAAKERSARSTSGPAATVSAPASLDMPAVGVDQLRAPLYDRAPLSADWVESLVLAESEIRDSGTAAPPSSRRASARPSRNER